MNATANLDIFDDEVSGGPAFPALEIRTHDTGDIVANADQGVTKRDWFAAQLHSRLTLVIATALMGEAPPPEHDTLKSMRYWARAEAKYRYLRADAMMEARKE